MLWTRRGTGGGITERREATEVSAHGQTAATTREQQHGPATLTGAPWHLLDGTLRHGHMWHKSDGGGWVAHDWRGRARSENSRTPQTNNNMVLALFAHLWHFVCVDISLRAYQCPEQ